MFVYLAMFAYVAIGAVINTFRKVSVRSGGLWITSIFLIILIGFRWNVGADWRTYRIALHFAENATRSVTIRMEPAYALLNSVAALQDWGIWFPNLICAVIFVYGLMVFCRQQPNPWLALVVAMPYLILGVGMGFTRQSAAVGLIMLATVQLTRGARVHMFMSIGLAALFHTSAIIIAPLFALTVLRRNVVVSTVLVLFGIALYLVFSERIALRMSEYQAVRYVAGGAVPRILMNIVPAVIFLFFRHRFTYDNEEMRFWTIISLTAFLLVPMLYFVPSTTIVDRVGIFLVPLQLFVLSRVPLAFSHERQQNVAFVFAIILYSLAAELVWLNFGTEALSWIPYRNLLWEQLYSA